MDFTAVSPTVFDHIDPAIDKYQNRLQAFSRFLINLLNIVLDVMDHFLQGSHSFRQLLILPVDSRCSS